MAPDSKPDEDKQAEQSRLIARILTSKSSLEVLTAGLELAAHGMGRSGSETERRQVARYGWMLLLSFFVVVAVALSYRQKISHDGGHVGPPAQVEEVDLAALKAKLAELKGRVVLVNLWATW